jgi:hypothetical protein
MAQDLELNALLHKIWDVDEKIVNGESITEDERTLYNANIETIQNYYAEKDKYWQNKKPV